MLEPVKGTNGLGKCGCRNLDGNLEAKVLASGPLSKGNFKQDFKPQPVREPFPKLQNNDGTLSKIVSKVGLYPHRINCSVN